MHVAKGAPNFPAWANLLLTHMPGLDWQKLGDDLLKAATAAGPLGVVEVTIEGSIRPKRYHLFVLVTAEGPDY
jgi:hypothetical protein